MTTTTKTTTSVLSLATCCTRFEHDSYFRRWLFLQKSSRSFCRMAELRVFPPLTLVYFCSFSRNTIFCKQNPCKYFTRRRKKKNKTASKREGWKWQLRLKSSRLTHQGGWRHRLKARLIRMCGWHTFVIILIPTFATKPTNLASFKSRMRGHRPLLVGALTFCKPSGLMQKLASCFRQPWSPKP